VSHKTKHRRNFFMSFGSAELEIVTGETVANASASWSATRCSCGWASGRVGSKELAEQAFEQHVREERRRKRNG